MEYYFCIMFTQSTENQMKFKYLAVLVFFVASAFGAARAQNVKGVVYGADTDEPLIGASVYWAGTTVGTGADAEGNYTIHRVKGYDMLVAGFVGYTSDTIRVESGVERVDFRLSNDGVELEEVVVNSTLGGNYVKRDGILKGEMISFAGLCKMACCNLAEFRELRFGDSRLQRRHFGCASDQDARFGRHLHANIGRKPSDHARFECSLRPELYAGHVAQFDPGVEGYFVRDCRT